ncbi:MAG: hypothetical protein HQL22_05935, partial [Candidatus Omnitrophica bacterium]|nr:hypothetical protein [Candidatus Omnitrophota bacterium]
MDKIKKVIAGLLLLPFFMTTVMPAALASAIPWMPQPGSMVSLTTSFTPVHLWGMSIHPNDPFKFDFLVQKGDVNFSANQKQEEYTKLIKYFLAALAIPDTDQWVNLSPYEKDRIVPDNFGLTEMGRDLLAQDYLLKQLSSSLTDPGSTLGKKFWDGVYEEAYKRFGTTDIPTDTFNKVWIMPDKAVVFEKNNTVYVLESHLKVLTEKDYLATSNNIASDAPAENKEIADISSKVMKDVIIPAIEKEVNEGKSFAPLRQVYSGMLLATWYKRALKESILGKLYADKSKVNGVDQDPKTNQEIYGQYVDAFKKGVFNMIKEDVDRYTKEVIPRKYFSGGFSNPSQKIMKVEDNSEKAKEEIAPMVSETDVVTAVVEDTGMRTGHVPLQTLQERLPNGAIIFESRTIVEKPGLAGQLRSYAAAMKKRGVLIISSALLVGLVWHRLQTGDVQNDTPEPAVYGDNQAEWQHGAVIQSQMVQELIGVDQVDKKTGKTVKFRKEKGQWFRVEADGSLKAVPNFNPDKAKDFTSDQAQSDASEVPSWGLPKLPLSLDYPSSTRMSFKGRRAQLLAMFPYDEVVINQIPEGNMQELINYVSERAHSAVEIHQREKLALMALGMMISELLASHKVDSSMLVESVTAPDKKTVLNIEVLDKLNSKPDFVKELSSLFAAFNGASEDVLRQCATVLVVYMASRNTTVEPSFQVALQLKLYEFVMICAGLGKWGGDIEKESTLISFLLAALMSVQGNQGLTAEQLADAVGGVMNYQVPSEMSLQVSSQFASDLARRFKALVMESDRRKKTIAAVELIAQRIEILGNNDQFEPVEVKVVSAKDREVWKDAIIGVERVGRAKGFSDKVIKIAKSVVVLMSLGAGPYGGASVRPVFVSNTQNMLSPSLVPVTTSTSWWKDFKGKIKAYTFMKPWSGLPSKIATLRANVNRFLNKGASVELISVIMVALVIAIVREDQQRTASTEVLPGAINRATAISAAPSPFLAPMAAAATNMPVIASVQTPLDGRLILADGSNNAVSPVLTNLQGHLEGNVPVVTNGSFPAAQEEVLTQTNKVVSEVLPPQVLAPIAATISDLTNKNDAITKKKQQNTESRIALAKDKPTELGNVEPSRESLRALFKVRYVTDHQISELPAGEVANEKAKQIKRNWAFTYAETKALNAQLQYQKFLVQAAERGIISEIRGKLQQVLTRTRENVGFGFNNEENVKSLENAVGIYSQVENNMFWHGGIKADDYDKYINSQVMKEYYDGVRWTILMSDFDEPDHQSLREALSRVKKMDGIDLQYDHTMEGRLNKAIDSDLKRSDFDELKRMAFDELFNPRFANNLEGQEDDDFFDAVKKLSLEALKGEVMILKAGQIMGRVEGSERQEIADKMVRALQNEITHREGTKDADFATKPEVEAGLKGGIDFAQSNLDMQIKRDGAGVPLPVSQQNLDNIRIDGLVPV